MHEAFGKNSRVDRPWSFEIVETDFFHCPPTDSPSRMEGARSRGRWSRWYSKRVEIRFIRHPFGRGPSKPCSFRCFLAEHRRFISTVYSRGRLRVPPSPSYVVANHRHADQMPAILLSPVPFMDIATPLPH